jgi:Na+-driven multidrug efflux pump
MLLQQMYSFIGVFIVSRFSANGAQALAAVGGTSSITSLLIGFFTGLSLGANVLCSNYIGARRQDDLRKTMNSSLSVAVLCGLLIILIGLTCSRQILVLMNVRQCRILLH